MIRNIATPFPLKSSFLSCEKDAEEIFRKLFIENQPHSNILKRLLVISNKDCLDNTTNPKYDEAINKASLSYLKENGYITLEPKISMYEHENIKAYIYLSFEDFVLNATNPQFRDSLICFDIICHTDHWDLGNYRLRPLKIAGYIDGMLNETKLSGIGTLHFLSCKPIIINEELSGYTLLYQAVHGSDDYIPEEEEELD